MEIDLCRIDICRRVDVLQIDDHLVSQLQCLNRHFMNPIVHGFFTSLSRITMNQALKFDLLTFFINFSKRINGLDLD